MNDTLANGTNFSIPITSTQLAVETAVNSINIILGLPINSYVLRLILSGAGGTIASEFFYLNLIVSVILFSLGSVIYIAWLFTYNSILLKVETFTFTLFIQFSVPSFLCCVCVERYIAVVHPVVFLRYKALRYRVVCCCAVWLTGFVVSLLGVIFVVYTLYFLLVFWVVCISVVCFCCLAVLRALKRPGPGEGQRDNGEGNDLKRRAFRIILISLVVMSVSVMSYLLFSLFPLLHYDESQVATTISSTIIMMSVFVHPLLYLHKAGKLPCFKQL